eukprot:c15810_g1_i2 orf=109-414(+)
MGDLHIPFCSIVAVAGAPTFCYRVCYRCESVLPDELHFNDAGDGNPTMQCRNCRASICAYKGIGVKRLYRLQISVATEERVMIVMAFDRAAQTLMGCSADE